MERCSKESGTVFIHSGVKQIYKNFATATLRIHFFWEEALPISNYTQTHFFESSAVYLAAWHLAIASKKIDKSDQNTRSTYEQGGVHIPSGQWPCNDGRNNLTN
jgi:hypothetical protein